MAKPLGRWQCAATLASSKPQTPQFTFLYYNRLLRETTGDFTVDQGVTDTTIMVDRADQALEGNMYSTTAALCMTLHS